MHLLHREQFVPRLRADVFAFFARPENLGRITPQWINLITLTPSPIPMRETAEIAYAIRLLGLRLHWRSRIEGFEPPRRFVDVQVKGPYRHWVHRHEFIEKGGGTLLIDHVEYALPLGWLGRAAHALAVRPALEKIFDFRARTVAMLLA